MTLPVTGYVQAEHRAEFGAWNYATALSKRPRPPSIACQAFSANAPVKSSPKWGPAPDSASGTMSRRTGRILLTTSRIMPDSTVPEFRRAILALRLRLSGVGLAQSGAAIETPITAKTLRVSVTARFPAEPLADWLRGEAISARRSLAGGAVEPERVTSIVPHAVEGTLVPRRASEMSSRA